MQPSLGINLKKYLFEPLDDNILISIENEILNTFKIWLPFVSITNIKVTMGEESDIGRNKLDVSVTFNINKSSNYFDTVNVTIGE